MMNLKTTITLSAAAIAAVAILVLQLEANKHQHSAGMAVWAGTKVQTGIIAGASAGTDTHGKQLT